MKITQIVPIVFFGFCATSSAAIIVVADATTPLEVRFNADASVGWNSVGADSSSNVYWDADTDGVFGETAINENDGDTLASVAFTLSPTIPITYDFALEGFGVTPSSVRFTVTDGVVPQFLNLAIGGSDTYTDSTTGQEWEISNTLTLGAYGDVVFNLGTGPSGDFVNDHQLQLTFTPVPEPSSVMLLGLAASVLGFRRKR